MASSPTTTALALPYSQRQAAVALLEVAGARGDVDALMQLAVWHLIGDGMARDLTTARAYLRRAVAIGHVDGALMEVALTANGTGGTGPAKFTTARQLLAIAAANDPVAARQLELVERMSLSELGRPLSLPAPEILSEAPSILRYRQLFTAEECAHVAAAAETLLEPAHVLDPRTGRSMPHPIRTSDGGAIGPTREDLVVRALNLRLAEASGTPVEHGEPLTVLRYAPGQQYRPHLDTIEGAANQRTKTVLVYLNQGYTGGETEFPVVPLKIQPQAGDAIVFTNLTAAAAPDRRTRHAGLPVGRGVKWMATRWIRQHAVDPWTLV